MRRGQTWKHLLLAVGAAMASLLTVLIIGAYWLQSRSLNDRVTGRLAAVYNLIGVDQKEGADKLNAILAVIKEDPRLQDAWRHQDRDRLLREARPMLDRLRSECQITHLYFFTVDQSVFLRVHKPESHGDRVSRYTLSRSVETGGPVAGMELGPFGTFTLRAVHPWRVDGNVVGYVELGQDIEHVTRLAQRILGVDILILIDKAKVSRRGFSEGMEMLGRRADWDRLSNAVIVDGTTDAVPPELDRWLQSASAREPPRVFEHTASGRAYRVGVGDLADVSGARVGSLVTLIDITSERAVLSRLTLGAVATCAATGLALVVLLRRVIRRAERISHAVRLQEQEAHEAEMQRERDLQRENLHFLQVLLDTAPSAIFYKDLQGHYLGCNETFAHWTGLARDEVIGRTAAQLFPDETARKFEEMDKALFAKPGKQVYELATVNRDGHKRDTLFHRATFVDAAGHVAGLVGVAVDISDRKRIEEQNRQGNVELRDTLAREKRISVELEAAMEQLRAATRDAQAATRIKTEFLANMSHEIRTPMTAILGFSENLLDPDLSEHERQMAIHTIRRNGEHLLQILNDILDISKIEAGKMEIERIDCSPAEIIADVQTTMQARAEAKRLSVEIDGVDDLPDSIRTDPTRLRQILINLVSNAIKFTAGGKIQIIARVERGEDGSNRLKVNVVDSGIGISRDQMDRLFVPFTQADSSTTRRFGGTGLGLTISKRLAMILGGDLAVSSEPGVGSTFTVTVEAEPLNVLSGTASNPHAKTVGKPVGGPNTPGELSLNVRILLAEDGPDNQMLIRSILAKAGAEVQIAENGKTAIERIEASIKDGRPYDLVLMDMQMPVLDGYQATSELRRRGYTGPIVALTAHAMATDRAKCLDSGCDDYATKPIDRQALIALVRQYTLTHAAS